MKKKIPIKDKNFRTAPDLLADIISPFRICAVTRLALKTVDLYGYGYTRNRGVRQPFQARGPLTGNTVTIREAIKRIALWRRQVYTHGQKNRVTEPDTQKEACMKILVGIDGSNTSREALQVAIKNARAFSGELMAVTSITTGTTEKKETIRAAEKTPGAALCKSTESGQRAEKRYGK